VKQLGQRMRDGTLHVFDGPLPEVAAGEVLVRAAASVVSAGTERAKAEVAREGLVGKARRRPDLAKQVLSRARREGIVSTMNAVRARLDAFAPLGYSAAGRVLAVGDQVRDLAPGDVVACGGEGANHAEVLAVPTNLCVRVPANVSVEDAAFTTLGSIALHSVRQAEVGLRDRVAVVGLGLIGQLVARIARAAGCEVLGVDLDPWRLDVARAANGVDEARSRADVQDLLDQWDAVIVTAAASTSDPVSLATDLARDRGVIIVVGDLKLELDRRRLYEKELSLRLSRSYGPGRYDREYEQRGLDYPASYVRWTERRNMGAFVDLLAGGSVAVGDLVTHSFPIADAPEAFEVLADRSANSLAILIRYPTHEAAQEPSQARSGRARSAGNRVAFIGAGSFAQRWLIPLIAKNGLQLDRVATASGLTAAAVSERFGFVRGACTVEEALSDPEIEAVVISTRHDRHADLVVEALRNGKATFVEKPLCLTEEELFRIETEAARVDAPPLMVGFNRRFAPLTGELRPFLLETHQPINALIRVNAGRLDPHHWLNDPQVGGGRLLGEGCHFLDLLLHLVGSAPSAVSAEAAPDPELPLQAAERFTVVVRFADGSIGTLVYGSSGSPTLEKELIEAHSADRSAELRDFSILRTWEGSRKRVIRNRAGDKGHAAELARFAAVVRGDADAPDPTTYFESTRVTLAALRALTNGYATSPMSLRAAD
jgi:predicted dehydrogenase